MRYTSDNRTAATKYWYPHDFAGLDFADSLLVKNIITRVVKSETYSDNLTIQGTVTTYHPDGTPSEMWKRSEAAPTDSSLYDPKQLLTAVYEKSGWIARDENAKRPREIHFPDGRVATLIWGYGRRYLVAQVMNKGYAEILTVPGMDLTALEASTDNLFINAKIEELRSHFPDAAITSYNYEPGVGVTLQVDPNGRKTQYQYDAWGRLSAVKDHEGNVVQNFQYNYKGTE